MTLIHKKDGFTIVEALIVAGVMGLLIAIAGTMVSKYLVSRSFDNAMKDMSSTLQMSKMKAARHGVEYRAVFSRCTNVDETDPDCPVCNTYVDFAIGDDTMTMSIERGNSNRGSDKWCIESTITKKMHSHMDVDMTAITETPPIGLTSILPHLFTLALLFGVINMGIGPAMGAPPSSTTKPFGLKPHR